MTSSWTAYPTADRTRTSAVHHSGGEAGCVDAHRLAERASRDVEREARQPDREREHRAAHGVAGDLGARTDQAEKVAGPPPARAEQVRSERDGDQQKPDPHELVDEVHHRDAGCRAHDRRRLLADRLDLEIPLDEGPDGKRCGLAEAHSEDQPDLRGDAAARGGCSGHSASRNATRSCAAPV